MQLISTSIVVDVDECEILNGGCSQECSNRGGSYACSCREGFVLGGDNTTCADRDECSTDPCSHTCVNLLGGFRCECPAGNVLDEDRVSCNGEMAK